MGITIYYAGKIKDVNLISALTDELIDLSKIAGWGYSIIDCRPNIYGIALDIHPKCETFLLTFGEDGALKYFHEYKDKGGKIKTIEASSLSVKTQYAGIKTHAIIINILRFIKKKYIPNLDVDDEADYWDKQDMETLKGNFAKVQAAIDSLGSALEDYGAGRKVESTYDQVIQAIEQYTKSTTYKESDIVENDRRKEIYNNEYDALSNGDIWTEEEWEDHFKKNEKLMDKYEKVYSEDPDREWMHPYDLYCKVHYGIDLGKDFSFASLNGDEEEFLISDDNGYGKENSISPPIDRHEYERVAYPILEESFEYSKAVIDLAKALEGRKNIQESISKYVSNSLQISAKLHGAHAMGYEMEALEGNIAVCKIAFKKADLAIEALEGLEPQIRDLISFAKMDEKLRQLKNNIEDWIEELREKVWWR